MEIARRRGAGMREKRRDIKPSRGVQRKGEPVDAFIIYVDLPVHRTRARDLASDVLRHEDRSDYRPRDGRQQKG